MLHVKQGGIKYHFWVFGMTRPGVELRSPGPLANSLTIMPISSILFIYIYITAQSGPEGPASLGAGSLYRILSPTDCTSCAPSYIIVRHPPSCGRHKSHSFNPSTVKVISWYSSTGCTCYLHWFISYFDSLAGVNMLQPECTTTIGGGEQAKGLSFSSFLKESELT